MFADDLEHLADKTLGCPVRHGDTATRPAYTCHFGGDRIRSRREHGSYQTHYQIELAVLKGYHLGVAFFEPHIEPFRLGTSSCLFDPIAGDIDACYAHTSTCSRYCDLPSTTSD